MASVSFPRWTSPATSVVQEKLQKCFMDYETSPTFEESLNFWRFISWFCSSPLQKQMLLIHQNGDGGASCSSPVLLDLLLPLAVPLLSVLLLYPLQLHSLLLVALPLLRRLLLLLLLSQLLLTLEKKRKHGTSSAQTSEAIVFGCLVLWGWKQNKWLFWFINYLSVDYLIDPVLILNSISPVSASEAVKGRSMLTLQLHDARCHFTFCFMLLKATQPEDADVWLCSSLQLGSKHNRRPRRLLLNTNQVLKFWGNTSLCHTHLGFLPELLSIDFLHLHLCVGLLVHRALHQERRKGRSSWTIGSTDLVFKKVTLQFLHCECCLRVAA